MYGASQYTASIILILCKNLCFGALAKKPITTYAVVVSVAISCKSQVSLLPLIKRFLHILLRFVCNNIGNNFSVCLVNVHEEFCCFCVCYLISLNCTYVGSLQMQLQFIKYEIFIETEHVYKESNAKGLFIVKLLLFALQ